MTVIMITIVNYFILVDANHDSSGWFEVYLLVVSRHRPMRGEWWQLDSTVARIAGLRLRRRLGVKSSSAVSAALYSSSSHIQLLLFISCIQNAAHASQWWNLSVSVPLASHLVGDSASLSVGRHHRSHCWPLILNRKWIPLTGALACCRSYRGREQTFIHLNIDIHLFQLNTNLELFNLLSCTDHHGVLGFWGDRKSVV
jgi:hypothetical protein